MASVGGAAALMGGLARAADQQRNVSLQGFRYCIVAEPVNFSRRSCPNSRLAPMVGVARCSMNSSEDGFNRPPVSEAKLLSALDYRGTITVGVDRFSMNSDLRAERLSCSTTRRAGLLACALVPLLTALEGFGVPQLAIAEEEEAVRLENICSEVAKAVSKGKAAGVLRLAFHDAGTFNKDTKKGGMNGSIVYELERPESAGLKRPLRVLEKVKTALEPAFVVSWADLIAVAGAESVAICGGPRISVKLGRLDSLSADPQGEMPEETLGARELKKKFQLKGFSTQELVALSGAHTIGNKGFGAPDIFDNSYYKILLEKPWLANGDSKGVAMPSMVGLVSDRNLTDDEECMKWVKVYADSQDQFFNDFSSAYLKLVNTGAQWA